MTVDRKPKLATQLILTAVPSAQGPIHGQAVKILVDRAFWQLSRMIIQLVRTLCDGQIPLRSIVTAYRLPPAIIDSILRTQGHILLDLRTSLCQETRAERLSAKSGSGQIRSYQICVVVHSAPRQAADAHRLSQQTHARLDLSAAESE